MDEQAFRQFLKKQRRSESAINRIVKFAHIFETYLSTERGGKTIEKANASDLRSFAESQGKDAKKHLWALKYAFEFNNNPKMRKLAGELREGKIERTALPLKEFMGVRRQDIRKLEAMGIRNTTDILEAGRTKKERQALAKDSKLPVKLIDELVKLSDIARIKGISGKRARLFHDAGADSIEKLASYDAEELRVLLEKFVKRTGFDGIAPYAKEVRCTIESAKALPIIIK
jgi:hypothetical protein